LEKEEDKAMRRIGHRWSKMLALIMVLMMLLVMAPEDADAAEIGNTSR
jgi:hypothetical protein